MKYPQKIPMKCINPKCPGYYFGIPWKDENKMCFQCRDAKEKRDREWVRITTEYLNIEGRDRL